MDQALNALLSWQFILFAIGISAIIYTGRTIAEYAFPKLLASNFYNVIVLRLSPMFIGGIVAFFAKSYAYPDGLGTLSARIMFGTAAGMFSGTIYALVKDMLKSKIQQYINDQITPSLNNVPQTNINVQMSSLPQPPSTPPSAPMGFKK